MTSKQSSRKIVPLPYPVYLWTVLVLVTIGLLDSIYLAVSHYRVYNDMGYRSFCAITKSINCDTVSQSSYAIFLGLPVSVWGIIGYAFVLLLMRYAHLTTSEHKPFWPLIFFVSLIYSIYSMVLAGISTFIIQSYCIMCILTYAINLILVYYSWLINNRFGNRGLWKGLKHDIRTILTNRRRSLSLILPFGAVLCLVWILFPNYWNMQLKENPKDLSSGLTQEGDPWIGAVNPDLTIVEYADYRCFQCRKMHFYLRDLVARHPESIRLVHRHFPMDSAYNPLIKDQVHAGAGRLALLSIYAASHGRFWQMNDLLFNLDKDHKEINMKKLALKCGLETENLAQNVNQPASVRKLLTDIKHGLKLGITATPSYVINDNVYTAQIPPDVLKSYLK